MEISTHALERFNERFPTQNLDQELKNAVPFAGQRHNEEFRLAPCGCVFVVANKTEQKGKVLKTVLTKNQAIANLQTFFPQIANFDFSYLIPTIPYVQDSVQPKPDPTPSNRSPAEISQIKEMASKHANEDHIRHLSPVESKNRRKEELAKLGLNLSNLYQKEYERVLIELNTARRKASQQSA